MADEEAATEARSQVTLGLSSDSGETIKQLTSSGLSAQRFRSEAVREEREKAYRDTETNDNEGEAEEEAEEAEGEEEEREEEVEAEEGEAEEEAEEGEEENDEEGG